MMTGGKLVGDHVLLVIPAVWPELKQTNLFSSILEYSNTCWTDTYTFVRGLQNTSCVTHQHKIFGKVLI